jgi:hypothetical protein
MDDEDTDSPIYLSNLGNAQRLYFQHHGDVSCLERAVSNIKRQSSAQMTDIRSSLRISSSLASPSTLVSNTSVTCPISKMPLQILRRHLSSQMKMILMCCCTCQALVAPNKLASIASATFPISRKRSRIHKGRSIIHMSDTVTRRCISRILAGVSEFVPNISATYLISRML